MFDSHVRWYLSASCILLVLLVLGTNAAFTRNVTLLVAAILVLPLMLFALLTLEGGQPARPLQLARARSTFTSMRGT
jgi:hypothetical protein